MNRVLIVVAAVVVVIADVIACGSLPISLDGGDAGTFVDASTTTDASSDTVDAGAVDIFDAGLCKPGHGYGDKNHCHVHKHP